MVADVTAKHAGNQAKALDFRRSTGDWRELVADPNIDVVDICTPTDDRSLDETMAVYNKDVVMVPKGYHPVATIAGYDSYYLNVMAGPTRKWLFTWEKDHQWVNGKEYAEKHASR